MSCQCALDEAAAAVVVSEVLDVVVVVDLVDVEDCFVEVVLAELAVEALGAG